MASYNVASNICQALGGGGGGGVGGGYDSVLGQPNTVSYLQLSQQTTVKNASEGAHPAGEPARDGGGGGGTSQLADSMDYYDVDLDKLLGYATSGGVFTPAAADAAPTASAGAPWIPCTAIMESEPAAAANQTGSPGLLTPAPGGVTR